MSVNAPIFSMGLCMIAAGLYVLLGFSLGYSLPYPFRPFGSEALPYIALLVAGLGVFMIWSSWQR
jgi:hypothetical protein